MMKSVEALQLAVAFSPTADAMTSWPILVDLERVDVRFGSLEERHLWRNPSP
ncbi:hypothetical protein [Streptomyces sp. M1013]|uniref:hypothetical protein n=1 Tax=Streptomyces sp. M1013 TaxID=549798 RepID=UPI0015C54876|nr:hypothetical protein [Streptomyces sp. M1013]